MTNKAAGASPHDRGVRPLPQQLRECADGKFDAFNPHWPDIARMLMRWAADAIDAANAASAESYRQAGWVCQDGFPALKGSKPLKPGAKLYASPNDWA